MDKIEEVKEILNKYKAWVLNADKGYRVRFNIDDAAQQICRLFHKERPPLLSDEEIQKALDKKFGTDHERFGYVAEAQRNLCIEWYER